MAAGTLRKDESGNKAISHLDFDGIFAAIPDAYALCGLEPPEFDE